MLAGLILASCGRVDPSSSDLSIGDSSGESTSEISSISGTDSSSSTSSITDSTSSGERPNSGTEIVDFYAINDFHGAISNDSYFGEPGLAKVASYLKDKQDDAPDNTVILSSGDMYQGSYDSYHNRGRVITESMNNIGFVSNTIGNHEFDWGTEDIINNTQWADFGMLGANIMNYPNTSTKADIGEEYVIIEKGHLRIGIIGVIGESQINSINSRYMQDLYFQEPTQIIKDLSTELRQQQNCDIVVLSIHGGQEEVDSSIPKGKYVDAIFCAHSHRNQSSIINGVPFIQGGNNGKFVSNIRLSFNYASNAVSYVTRGNTYEGQLETYGEDSAVKAIIDNYASFSNPAKLREVGSLTDTLYRSGTLPNMANYAVAAKAQELSINIDFALTNYGRSDIPSGNVNYGDLFKGLPFDNYVYIVRSTGRNIKSQAGASSNYFYRVKDYTSLSDTSYYTVAVVDYVLLHQNISKQYNYFTDYNPTTDYMGYLMNNSSQPYFPRDLLEEQFIQAPNHIIHPSFYTGDRYSNLTV